MSLRRRMGPPPRVRPAPPARPVHAGALPVWERLAFTAVFALMISFVVVVTISSTRAHGQHPVTTPAVPGGLPASGSQPVPAVGGAGPARGARRAAWDRRLASALAPVLRDRTGNLAVGVIDATTGARALYGARLRFHTASIVKPDILAALLLQSQRAGRPLSRADEDLATQMIEASDDAPATTLWNRAGRAGGLAAADVRLGLRHTTPGPGALWGLTSTTVGDQLRLLTDLTTARSPLRPGSRAYVLGLLRHVEAAQLWGVPAAASPGTSFAVKDGWLPDGSAESWVINSIGAVIRDHQRLLIAVLSSDQPTMAAGIAQDEAAAVAAAGCVTSPRRPAAGASGPGAR